MVRRSSQMALVQICSSRLGCCCKCSKLPIRTPSSRHSGHHYTTMSNDPMDQETKMKKEVRPKNLQPYLPGLEPSFTIQELEELTLELLEIEKAERTLATMFKEAKRRSNALQYGSR